MKISERWLREWVDPPLSAERLAEQLTMAGLEVESVTPLRPDWGPVVAGRVESIEPHGSATGLKICRVSAGPAASLQVVCGAPGVAAGKVYALALPGARLADGSVVEAMAIRGLRSAGMLCSRAELGIGDEASRLLELDGGIAAGTPLVDALALDDHVLEIALTPNRGDCLSLGGIAREVGVLNELAVTAPRGSAVPVSAPGCRMVRLDAPHGCPRYLGRVIEDVDIGRPTPVGIVERLRRADVRDINLLVDVTNYVMLELGQPLHAFDHSRLNGDLCVRWAQPDEPLVLLDGREAKLAQDTLVIADASGAVAVAGIIGGQRTAVGPATRHVFLEGAFFTPDAVLGRARRLGVQTDASQRYERGVDPSLPERALERATELILRHGGGRASPITQAVSEAHLPARPAVLLRPERMQSLLGMPVEVDRATQILERLGFKVEDVAGGLRSTPPPHRFDIALEADLIEEVARIQGYEEIPSRRPGGRLRMHRGRPDARPARWRRALADRGYCEAITYSFVDEAWQSRLFPDQSPVRLLNPISAEMGVMRLSLWPGLLRAVQHNQNRQHTRVRLFEIGRVFTSGGELVQEMRIAGMAFGNIYEEQWDRVNRICDFYDVKGDVQALLADLGVDARMGCEAAGISACHPGQSAEILLEKQCIGTVGALHPGLLSDLGVAGPVLAFELIVPRIPLAETRQFVNFSRFPSMRRDLALIVDRNTPVAELLNEVRAHAGELLSNLELFDVYEGEGVDLGKKSLALGLIFQKSSSTLIDAEVEAALSGILGAVQRKFGATLRH